MVDPKKKILATEKKYSEALKKRLGIEVKICRLENTSDNHNKFYECFLIPDENGYFSLESRYGAINASAQNKVYVANEPRTVCIHKAEKLISAKKKKGYRVVS